MQLLRCALVHYKSVFVYIKFEGVFISIATAKGNGSSKHFLQT